MGAENNFMEYAQIVFYQLVIFVIYGAIGVAAVKGGILDEAGLHAVSRVVIKVTLPVCCLPIPYPASPGKACWNRFRSPEPPL